MASRFSLVTGSEHSPEMLDTCPHSRPEVFTWTATAGPSVGLLIQRDGHYAGGDCGDALAIAASR